eukprot:1157887-Pelagomonas_calceolata.AAC.1
MGLCQKGKTTQAVKTLPNVIYFIDKSTMKLKCIGLQGWVIHGFGGSDRVNTRLSQTYANLKGHFGEGGLGWGAP